MQSIQRGVVTAKKGIPFPFVHEFTVNDIKRSAPKRAVLIEKGGCFVLSGAGLSQDQNRQTALSILINRVRKRSHIVGTAVGIHEIIGRPVYLIIDGNPRIFLGEEGVLLFDGNGRISLPVIVQMAVGQCINLIPDLPFNPLIWHFQEGFQISLYQIHQRIIPVFLWKAGKPEKASRIIDQKFPVVTGKKRLEKSFLLVYIFRGMNQPDGIVDGRVDAFRS